MNPVSIAIVVMGLVALAVLASLIFLLVGDPDAYRQRPHG